MTMSNRPRLYQKVTPANFFGVEQMAKRASPSMCDFFCVDQAEEWNSDDGITGMNLQTKCYFHSHFLRLIHVYRVFLGDLVENIKPGSGEDQEIEEIFRCFFSSWDFFSLDQMVKEVPLGVGERRMDR
jgi:hypothetical protein